MVRAEDFINMNLQGLEQQLKGAGYDIETMAPVKIPSSAGSLYGYDETQDVAALGINLVKAIVVKDKPKIQLWIAVVMSLPAAVTNIDLVPAELKDLDQKEADALTDFIIVELGKDLPDLTIAKAQGILEHSLKAAYHIYSAVMIALPEDDSEERDLHVRPAAGDPVKEEKDGFKGGVSHDFGTSEE